jgi:hypothetical protein
MLRDLVPGRNGADVNPLFELNILQAPAEGVKFLFDSEDLLETGLAIQSPNANPIFSDRYMGLLKLNLPVMDLEAAIEAFPELSCAETQFGVDDGNVQFGAKFCATRHEEAEAVITLGSIVDARQFIRRGCPPGLRARLWRRACGLYEEPLAVEEADFLRLRVDCDRLDLLTDELFMHDIQTVLDDPRYFIYDVSISCGSMCLFCEVHPFSPPVLRHCTGGAEGSNSGLFSRRVGARKLPLSDPRADGGPAGPDDVRRLRHAPLRRAALSWLRHVLCAAVLRTQVPAVVVQRLAHAVLPAVVSPERTERRREHAAARV